MRRKGCASIRRTTWIPEGEPLGLTSTSRPRTESHIGDVPHSDRANDPGRPAAPRTASCPRTSRTQAERALAPRARWAASSPWLPRAWESSPTMGPRPHRLHRPSLGLLTRERPRRSPTTGAVDRRGAVTFCAAGRTIRRSGHRLARRVLNPELSTWPGVVPPTGSRHAHRCYIAPEAQASLKERNVGDKLFATTNPAVEIAYAESMRSVRSRILIHRPDPAPTTRRSADELLDPPGPDLSPTDGSRCSSRCWARRGLAGCRRRPQPRPRCRRGCHAKRRPPTRRPRPHADDGPPRPPRRTPAASPGAEQHVPARRQSTKRRDVPRVTADGKIVANARTRRLRRGLPALALGRSSAPAGWAVLTEQSSRAKGRRGSAATRELLLETGGR
jgi:hypothetical protein